jgi:predicted oxidoreductase
MLSDGPDGKRVTGIVDYCRLHDIGVQAYATLRGELLAPTTEASNKVKEGALLLRQIADQRNTTPWTIALSWVLRHPATIIPILGSTNPTHIAENCFADTIRLNRDEWYKLLDAAKNAMPT